MPRPTLTTETRDGFERVCVTNDQIAVTLMPQLGGKLSSLKDLRSGREWLWRHPRMPYLQVPADASYVHEADTGGWDECFPTVAPCPYPLEPWQGVALPDHGELWSQSAHLTVRVEVDAISLVTRWQGAKLPYSFERRLTLAADRPVLRCDYRVRNQSATPLAFIWCAHPLIAIEPGMRLAVPEAARFNVWAALPPNLVAARHGLSFPPPLQAGQHELNLAELPPAPGIALKLWSDPLVEGWAAIQAHDGVLRFSWDVALLPQLALWMNLGAWAADGGEPYYNLGLEPCIGAQDALDQAVREQNLYASVPPHATRAWWLEVELTPNSSSAC